MQKVINAFNELLKEVIESQTTYICSGGRGRGDSAVAGKDREASCGTARSVTSFPDHCPRKTVGHSSCPWSIPSKGRAECISWI